MLTALLTEVLKNICLEKDRFLHYDINENFLLIVLVYVIDIFFYDTTFFIQRNYE